jgi:ribokinase
VLILEFGVPLPAIRHSLALARKAGVLTLVNPAPVRELPQDFYREVDVLVPNEVEAGQLCGQSLSGRACLERAAAYFHGRQAKQVVITLGEKGAFVSDGRRQELLPGHVVEVADTTGAGDAFVGGLACLLAEGRDIFAAARFANAAAALSVTRPGAAQSMPCRAEVEEFLRERRAMAERIAGLKKRSLRSSRRSASSGPAYFTESLRDTEAQPWSSAAPGRWPACWRR